MPKNKKKGNSNFDYLQAVSFEKAALDVNNLQRTVAEYKIKENIGYDKNRSSDYEMELESADCHISAKYNANGKILSSTEQFRNKKLPRKLSGEIVKNYPNWVFV